MDKVISVGNVKGILDTDNWGLHITCPVDNCTCQYVHILKSTEKKGEDNYKAWQGRGDAVLVEMFCEEGHQWVMRLGEHKGYVYLGNEDHPNGVNYVI